MTKLQTISEWLSEHSHLDPFTIPEGEIRFNEPGIHTVFLSGPMGKQDYLIVKAYSNGAFSVIEEHLSLPPLES